MVLSDWLILLKYTEPTNRRKALLEQTQGAFGLADFDKV